MMTSNPIHFTTSYNEGLLRHSKLLVQSYNRITRQQLIQGNSELDSIEGLFTTSKIILSHGTEADPILNYGNQAALSLWEMTWEQFIAMPSKLTAEPMIREEREVFLHQVTKNGFIDNYYGIRISSSGRKFKIMNAVVWNLVDTEGIYRGQAAAFEQYEYLT